MHRVRVWRRGRPLTDVVLGTELSIGRHPDNALALPDERVSGRHARLVVEDDACFLLDLGSLHGTEVDGERIPPATPQRLRRGERISVGSFDIEYGPDQLEFDVEFVLGLDPRAHGAAVTEAALQRRWRIPGRRCWRLERALGWVATAVVTAAMAVVIAHRTGLLAGH